MPRTDRTAAEMDAEIERDPFLRGVAWLERALAAAGCTHVPAHILEHFRRDRDAGYYVREFGAVEEWLRPQPSALIGPCNAEDSMVVDGETLTTEIG